jgi:translation initiation factor IF-2
MEELESRQGELGLILNSPFSIVPDAVAKKIKAKLDKREDNPCLLRKKPIKKATKRRAPVKKKKVEVEAETFAEVETIDDVGEASTIMDVSEESQTQLDVAEESTSEVVAEVAPELPPQEETAQAEVEPEAAPVEVAETAPEPIQEPAAAPEKEEAKPAPAAKKKGPAPQQKYPAPLPGQDDALELGKISKKDTDENFAVGRIVSEAPNKPKAASAAAGKKKKRRAVVDPSERLAEWSAKYGVIVPTSAPKKSAPLETKGSKLQRMQLVYGHELPKKVRQRESERESVKKDNSLKVECPTDVRSLSEQIGVKSTDVIKFLMTQGMFMTITDRLERDMCEVIATEFEKEVVFVDVKDVSASIKEIVTAEQEQQGSKDLKARPPVITIMGHVDHGKTSLLDSIRMSQIAEGESGGITQHIGGYQVEKNGHVLTFLDTPGHAAFTAMRARGANVTDLVILLVAADDGVMPQTEEAVNHAKAAGVPIIVAMNKMDLEGANPNKIKEQLAALELIPEEWSGSTPYMPVSAKTGEGINELLEMINLQTEMLELNADYGILGDGVVIEAHQEPGRGVVASILVRNGYLKKGDPILCGRGQGFLRQMEDENGKVLKKAGPSKIVKLTGLSECPSPGDVLNVMPNIKKAKEMATERQANYREEQISAKSALTMESLMDQLGSAEVKEFNVVVKADVQGTVEALEQALKDLGNEEVGVKIIHRGVGTVTESDVILAKASNAIILAFRVSADGKTRRMSQDEGVEIRNYDVIYSLLEEVEQTLEGLLDPDIVETLIGEVEVRQVFRITNVGNIAGCFVKSGHVERNMPVRLIRDGAVVWKGKIQALRRFKEDVKRVETRYECGIRLENYEDIRAEDIIETYTVEEVVKTL